ncbi:MAG: AzlD domain-containing protein [Acidaminococcaceae bacterium]|nr:AzlD domain-containing protein [Acidaminococcaceae bacterium]
MSKEYIWSVIILMSIVTYLPRALPMLVLSHYALPAWFTKWLTFVPTAIFGALVFPDIFIMDGHLSLAPTNFALWTTVLIAPLALKTKSLGITIAAGATVFAILQYLI